MIWTSNAPWLSWSAFMALGTVLTLITARFMDAGEHLPVTKGFGKEISLAQGIRELYRFASIWLLTATLLTLWGWRAYLGGWSWWDGAALASAAAIYPFTEWWFHTRISHSKPLHVLGGLQVQSVFSRFHHGHHRDPYNRAYAVSPMVTFVQYVFVFPGVAYLLLPAPCSISFAAMTVTMIFRYESFHFLFHAPYKPRSKWFRRIRDHHLWHHFQNEDYWYNIADLVADRCLGTEVNPKEVPRSSTCRNLPGQEAGPPPTGSNRAA